MSGIAAIAIIARLTLREAVRRKLLWSLAGLTIAIAVLTAWGFSRLADASPVTGPIEMVGVSQVLVLLAFMFSFVLAMTAVFAASPAIGPEIESGLLLAMLARPIRRGDVLLGRWLGLSLVLVVYALVAGYLEIGAVAWATGYLPAEPVQAPLYLAGQTLVLLTLAIVFSTRIASVAGGAVAVVAYGLAWMAGILGGAGDSLHSDVLRWAGFAAHVVLPSDILWRGSVFALSPTEQVLKAGGLDGRVLQVSPFYASSPPGPLWLAWCVVWIVAALAVGIVLLRDREV
ncbi:MAG TPA: ABC transporter permease [Terriglobales bacterium]|nr:ABC transporter permease [Terriglobales bacterium]